MMQDIIEDTVVIRMEYAIENIMVNIMLLNAD